MSVDNDGSLYNIGQSEDVKLWTSCDIAFGHFPLRNLLSEEHHTSDGQVMITDMVHQPTGLVSVGMPLATSSLQRS